MFSLNQLEKYRRIVDDIDSQVVSLIERRMEISRRIGEVKKQNDLPFYNPEREQLILQKNSEYLRDTGFSDEIQELYTLILRQSYNIQVKTADNEEA